MEEQKKRGRPLKEQNEEEYVQVKKTKLEELMARLERVEYAADKAHLATFDNVKDKNKGKSVNLRMIDGKVIVAWSDMVKNMVEKDEHGIWREDQQVELTFEDGTKQVMPYVFFTRRYQLLFAEVIQEISTPDGTDITFKVKTRDGKEYLINSRFIN